MTTAEVYSFAFLTTWVDKNPHNKNNSVIFEETEVTRPSSLFLGVYS